LSPTQLVILHFQFDLVNLEFMQQLLHIGHWHLPQGAF
jgi:hypothetical protein